MVCMWVSLDWAKEEGGRKVTGETGNERTKFHDWAKEEKGAKGQLRERKWGTMFGTRGGSKVSLQSVTFILTLPYVRQAAGSKNDHRV